MKKFIVAAIGLGLVLSTVTLAQDGGDKKMEKKKKGGKKKKGA
jgi:hypothetical protein